MEPYSLRFKASVEKDLRRLPTAERLRCLRLISELRDFPLPHGARRLVGAEHIYRLRIGSYRVVYQIDDIERCVLIVYVRHRKDAYR